MKQTKKTQLLAGILAALMIAAPGTIGISGDETSTGDTGSSSSTGYETATLAELLATIEYSEYLERYNDIPSGKETVTLSGDKITGYNADITNALGVQKLTLDNGKELLYLPSDGAVGWKINIPAEGMYNLKLTYYPVSEVDTKTQQTVSKTTSIERTFFINEKLPFYEARFLTMTKSWADDKTSFQLDSNGNVVSKYMKDGKVVYEYVDIDGNILKRGKDENRRLCFTQTGEKVDQAKIEGCERYPVYQNDINGNEIKSDKDIVYSSDKTFTISELGYDVRVGERTEYFALDSSGYYVDPLRFYFNAGENTIQLEAQRESMAIESIELVPVTSAISYEEYRELHKDAPNYSGESIKLQGEYVAATSENTVYATNDRTSYITEPQDATKLMLNAIGGDGGEKWKNVGQWVRWQVDAPSTGWYQITLRFKQSVLEGTFSSRTLRVATQSMINEGKSPAVPFAEAQYLQFNYSDDWQVAPLNNGQKTEDGKSFVSLDVYLEEGTNYIELEASLGNMADILRRVEASMTTVNAIYIKILMITGAEPDSNADYGFYRIMPNDIDELVRQAAELQSIADNFATMMNSTGSHAKTLEKVAMLLERMGLDEDKIASNLGNLKENLGTLGTWLQTSTEQPLEIDYIAVEAPGTDVKTHKANDGFFQAMWFEINQFFRSFVSDYNTLGSMEEVDPENTIEVWTTLGRDQAMIIRNLINSDFNATHSGISIELKLVAGGSLLPSVLAGVGPDVSMGHGAGDVINWAIRSAVMPLNTRNEDGSFVLEGLEDVVGKFDETAGFQGGSFDSDGNFVGGYFTQAAIEPLELFAEFDDSGDGVADRSEVLLYGIPETQSFAMMFYRADIFQNLGLEPPKTWNDLEAILPVFQNNHMEVALPNKLGGLNLFNYQMGGNLYADNGKIIGFEEDVTLTAFDYMCSFFTKFKCPYQYDFANRFRTGEIPMGILDYTSYTQLSVYATEIRGLWEFVPLPGMRTYDAEGNITGSNNTSVSGVSAMIMLYDAKRTAQQTANAWEYMKWYVGDKNQSAYANELTALLGTVSKHSTANVNALSSLSWTTSEYKNLMSQFTNLAAVREYPGGYIITRYVDFAFMSAYNDNADPTEALLSYVTEINKEITRKRKEFNMTYYADSADRYNVGEKQPTE